MRHSYNLAATLLSAGLLAACGGIGVAPSSGLPGAVPGSRGLSGSPAHAERHSSIAYAVLHSFKGGSGDGTNSRMRVSSTSRARSTARPTTGGTNGYGTAFAITTIRHGSSCSTASKAARETARYPKLRTSSTSRGRSTARRNTEAPTAPAITVTERSSRSSSPARSPVKKACSTASAARATAITRRRSLMWVARSMARP